MNKLMKVSTKDLMIIVGLILFMFLGISFTIYVVKKVVDKVLFTTDLETRVGNLEGDVKWMKHELGKRNLLNEK